jgi:hypothetical protein
MDNFFRIDVRRNLMQRLCYLVNGPGPVILTVYEPKWLPDAEKQPEPFFVVQVPIEQLGAEYAEAMLRLANEFVRREMERYNLLAAEFELDHLLPKPVVVSGKESRNG